ncbi:MAG: sigma-70 family RNA polymerase sigma factor [Gemmataceae bacterium]|nr:sigma-70 family RNA polymerase sigma factor [Gemmataceae bacterium]
MASGQLTSTEGNDGQLLERFVTAREEAAFAGLVHRHGPMVLGVCRRMLLDVHDADDAFQATFLVLVRRAKGLRQWGSLGNWLHGVAYRVALKARARTLRRRARETEVEDVPHPVDEAAAWRELRPVLDAEVDRLPAKYRRPVVLCYLEGRTHEEAASELGWPSGTVKCRLVRAREMLRKRLIRRGLTVAAAAVAAGLGGNAVAAVPATLEAATVHGATLLAAGQTAAVSAPTLALVEGVLHTMTLFKIKIALSVLVTVSAIAGGVFLVGQPGAGAGLEGDPSPSTAAGTTEPGPMTTPARSTRPEERATAKVPATTPGDDPDWGTIRGQLVFAGDRPPEPQEINVDKDRDHCLANGKLLSESWVVNKDSKGVRWVFVWLAPEPGTAKKLPIHPSLADIKQKEVDMDQPCCQFVPHCLAMREGQTLVAKNSSPIGHNVNYTGHPLRNPGKNVSVGAKASIRIDDLKADERFPVQIACNLHGWMKGYVRVFDHPYFALTDADGKFEIENAPAGEWRMKVWQEAMGWRGGAAGRDGEKITVKGGTTTDLGKLDLKP